MKPSKLTVGAVAAGVVALGAGIGVVGIASAEPTPTPSATAPGAPSPGADRPGGHVRGAHESELARQLASKLGVTEAKVSEALRAIREENKPTARPDPGTRPDGAERATALAQALAEKLGIDEANVKAALDEIWTAEQAERAAALKDRLDAAVADGTLTQAEADAVQKAVEKGVINAGGGRR